MFTLVRRMGSTSKPGLPGEYRPKDTFGDRAAMNDERAADPAACQDKAEREKRSSTNGTLPLVSFAKKEFDPRNNRKAGCFARRGAGNGDG
jgi:hypothetical protein